MSSSDTPKAILLGGSNMEHGEYQAGGAITPGMLIELGSGGTVTSVATSNKLGCARWFARENSYAGGDIDDAYAQGDVVPFWKAKPGDRVYAWVVAGTNVAKGASLAPSATTGYLQASTTAGAIIARALEAVNTTPAGRIRVEII